MRFEIKHALTLVLIGFLAAAPIVATAYSGAFVVAQDGPDLENLIGKILEEGAEVMFANINDEGEPGVIYGQLGIPSDDLDLDNEMYDGCIAMALVSTHGEFIELVLDMIGMDMTSGGDGGGFDVNSILDIIGTEFNLLVNVFLNVPEPTSISRMSSILTSLSGTFGFSFAEIFTIRIDQSMFEGTDITLPEGLESIDVFIHQELSDFDVAVDSMLSVMDESGFLAQIDETKFTASNAAAAGLITVPDMGAIVELMEGFMGNTTGGDGGVFLPSALYEVSQFSLDALDGPIAIAAVGYLGEQVLSTTDTQLSIGTLFGTSEALTPITGGQALVIGQLPSSINITGYDHSETGFAYYENETNMVIWNSSALGAQNDYRIFFEEGDFPPLISIARTFSPATTTVGGSTTVTVTVTNGGDAPIYNVSLDDSGIGELYPTVTVSGDISENFTSIAAGASEHITYTVSFVNEGGYTFPKALIEYDFEGDTFEKDTIKDGFVVTSDALAFLNQLILDAWPYSGAAIGLIALVGIYSIYGMTKSKSGGSTFQV